MIGLRGGFNRPLPGVSQRLAFPSILAMDGLIFPYRQDRHCLVLPGKDSGMKPKFYEYNVSEESHVYLYCMDKTSG